LKHRLTPKGGSIHGDKQKNCEKFSIQGQSQGGDARLGSTEKTRQACKGGGQEPCQEGGDGEAKIRSGEEASEQSPD
jgi:hypothetical protein